MRELTNSRYATAADETAAYDLVELLIRREGVRTVLATLRAWYVLTQLGGKRRAAVATFEERKGNTRQSANNAFSTSVNKPI